MRPISQPSLPRCLVLAPLGRDAMVAASLLREAAMEAAVFPDFPALVADLGEDACMAVVTEEAARPEDLPAVAAWVSAQPSWSDFPFIVLTARGGGVERSPTLASFSAALGNVTFLERPFHPATFISVARTALRGRKRQFEARDRIKELYEAEERLRRLNETLEERVGQRTADLERAHGAVVDEMRQRQRAEDQLRQAQKMEMIGQLTGGVAHDFNNLLMVVLGNLELLSKNLPPDPKLLRLAESAAQGAQRGAALTRRLLAFARQQDLALSPTDVTRLVADMRPLIERSIPPSIELRIDLPPSLPPALADANQLELALLNLVVNARDAMPDGGTLAISLALADNYDGDDLARGAYVRLAVADNGHGMDAHTLAHAIEPFFSTKEVGKGTGLGLSMIHGLARQLKGALRLDSAPGRGTVAELWLPVSQPAAKPPAPELQPAEPPAAAKATILVVDDDALIAMSTVDMLEDLGHDVVQAHSGSDSLAILGRGQAVDLLITDFSMPRMNGSELAEAARKLRPGLPILLATGYAELPRGSRLDLPRIGKPYDQAQLAAEIARLLVGPLPGAAPAPQPAPLAVG